MPDLSPRKAGIVACSCEELAEGTVTRLAALKVLHALRPQDTVTICLPLFLAGGQGDRAFARFHPTITVDGCELRCAARATEMHSGKPAVSLVVSELLAARGMDKPEGRRRLNEAGRRAVEVLAEVLAAEVDKVLGRRGRLATTHGAEPQSRGQAACSCGSGIPVTVLSIAGQPVELVALPLVLQQFREAGRQPDEILARELLDAVKVYNLIPPQLEAVYRQAILAEYAASLEQEAAK
jgi:hypothetical protein